MRRERRLLALEIQDIRAMVAEATPPGVTVDQMLDFAIEFLTQWPPEEQKAHFPGYSDEEWQAVRNRVPLYRLARHGPAKGHR